MSLDDSRDFLTEIPYVDFDDFLLGEGIVDSPHFFCEFSLWYGLLMISCEVEKELVLTLREIYRLPVI